jgi:fructose-bisphosphate aldolase class II
MLVDGRDLLEEAVAKKRAAGSFNTYNLEITRAILQAAEARRAPVFLAVGKAPLDQAGFAPLVQAMLAAAKGAAVPVAVHLDHSPDSTTIRRCVDAGFTSVMVDGSRLPFADNVTLTRDAVAAAQGVATEAELGGVAGAEDRSGDQTAAIPMTDADEAARFVAETGIDSLAIAIGNAHGVYTGEPHLDFGRLEALSRSVSAPLVLHGASGISDADLRHCVELGVRKINVNTEIRIALFESVQASLERSVEGYDVIRLFGAAVGAMQLAVEQKLAVMGWE